MVVPSRRKKFLKKVMAILLVIFSLVASIEAKGRGGGGRGRSRSSGGTESGEVSDPTYSGDWGPCQFLPASAQVYMLAWSQDNELTFLTAVETLVSCEKFDHM